MKIHLLISLGASVASLALAPAAMAQETASDDAGIGDIVVTAQKRAENVQDIPIAISAVSSAYLESRGISSIDTLGSIAPNVKFERAPSSKTISQISIRGSVTINPSILWEPAVGLYLDGVYIAKGQGSIFDVADLERVEILRGPQGTLYGRNALAGAVNLITKKPSGELGGSAEVSYGNYDAWRAKASIDLPKMGIFSAKIAGQLSKRDGLVKITPNPYPQAFLAGTPSINQIDTVDSKSLLAQLRAELSDNFTADYSFDYNKQNQLPPFAQLLRVNRNGDARDIFDPNSESYIGYAPLDLYTNPNRVTTASVDSPVYERLRTYGHSLTLTGDLGAAELKSITSYRNMHWSDGLDLDGSPLGIAFTQRISTYDAFSQELQLSGKALEDRLAYVVGGFYFKEKAETLGPQAFFGLFGPDGNYYQSDYGSHTEAFAVYSQLDYKLTDALKLTLGGRYTHERKDIRRYFAAADSLANLADASAIVDLPYGGVPDATYNNFSPAVTLGYEVSDSVNVYGRFARGFKSGGFNGETNVFYDPGAPEGCPQGLTELCEPYRPEKVDSYEIGLKSKLLDNRLILNLAAFYDRHKDIQLSIFTAQGAASSVVRNAASARIQGIEVEAIARPTDALTINASLATLSAKYLSYVDAGEDVADNRAFPHTPKFTASLGVDWRVLEGNWGKLNLNGDVNHVSAYFTFPYALTTPTASDQNAYNTRSKGRTIVNLRAALSDFDLGGVKTEISAWVRNVTKEHNPSNFIDFGPGFGGITLGYFPDPRTYGLTFGVRF
ncbi:MAG: TonB-dependent receptor [Chakrabartia sp.]